jgi:ABC-type multidrug transport system fused ATPase/permease subunit
MARAILRKSKVVLMDEVTSSIDYSTDKLLQETIRTCPELRSATILTIAHRLRTIADSDFILVLGPGGQLLEKGKPYDLLTSENSSHFKSLAMESQEFDDLISISSQSRIE